MTPAEKMGLLFYILGVAVYAPWINAKEEGRKWEPLLGFILALVGAILVLLGGAGDCS
jgi:hypothetical protein